MSSLKERRIFGDSRIMAIPGDTIISPFGEIYVERVLLTLDRVSYEGNYNGNLVQFTNKEIREWEESENE